MEKCKDCYRCLKLHKHPLNEKSEHTGSMDEEVNFIACYRGFIDDIFIVDRNITECKHYISTEEYFKLRDMDTQCKNCLFSTKLRDDIGNDLHGDHSIDFDKSYVCTAVKFNNKYRVMSSPVNNCEWYKEDNMVNEVWYLSYWIDKLKNRLKSEII